MVIHRIAEKIARVSITEKDQMHRDSFIVDFHSRFFVEFVPVASLHPIWYSGGEGPVMLSFESIKRIIATSDDILSGEIRRAAQQWTIRTDRVGNINTRF